MHLRTFLSCDKMKPLNWVELTRQQIKARHGFGWSIQGIEKQNKVLTKIVYRFSTGGRTTVLTDIEWNTNNSKKIQDLIIEFETLMNERHVDLSEWGGIAPSCDISPDCPVCIK